jgi:alcohol oxidase
LLTCPQKWAKYISPDGKRQDAAHTYIHPLMKSGDYPNLHLLVDSKVKRVLFDDNKRATGIEYEPSATSQPITGVNSNQTFTVTAKRMVVVSSGALGTPSVLERSGVGNKDILSKLDIPVVSDLPDVGENYQDHHLVLYPYKTSLKPEKTIDGFLAGRKDFGEAIQNNDPMLGWNAIDISSKIRPTDKEIEAMGPQFKEHWDKDFKDRPTRPVMLTGVVQSFLGDHKLLPQREDGVPEQYATVGAYTAYPYSRGDIHITSKDVKTPASFNTGFFKADADVKKQIWAYKKQREVYRRTEAYAGELAMGHPVFPEGSKAALQDGPVAKFTCQEDRNNLPEIEYSAEDDKAIEEHVRDNVNTTWHSLGTCRMAPRDKGGVVDADLNVYGVTGLKLCDLSICPGNVGANTNNTALLVGEKAADILIKDLGLGGTAEQIERIDSAMETLKVK